MREKARLKRKVVLLKMKLEEAEQEIEALKKQIPQELGDSGTSVIEEG